MTKAVKEVKLPNKLSDCLELAIKDLTAVERMKKAYTVFMDDYHEPETVYTNGVYEPTGKCSVCFAGAVMARTLGTSPKVGMSPSNFSTHNRDRLLALDNLRCGQIDAAFSDLLGEDLPFGLATEVDVTVYSPEESKDFKADMKKIVKLLRMFGE